MFSFGKKDTKNKEEKKSNNLISKATIFKWIIVFITISILIFVVIIDNKSYLKMTRKEGKNKELFLQIREKNPNNFTYVISKDGIEVPVPKGYTASSSEEEQYVNVQKDVDGNVIHQGGFVIYEGTDEIPLDYDGLFEAQKTRNQWVWVPISSEQINEIYHMNGTEFYSNQYSFPSAIDENDQTSKANITITRSNYEPRVVGKVEYDNSLVQYLDEGQTLYQFKNELQQRYYDLLMSIQTYGGFYIGRYETGDLSKNTAVVKRMNGDLGNQNWYTMYQLCKRLKGNNESVDTNMLYGSQYDEVIKWFVDTDALTLYQVVNDASSWGNLYDNSIPYMYNTSGAMSTTTLNGYGRKKMMSGASDYTKVNNIYDLCGNVFDWTMDWYAGNSGRWVRGANYGVTSTSAKPAQRTSFLGTTVKYEYLGCRATLYIK